MKRTPLRKTAKPKTASYYRKKCVEIAKSIAKHRDGYTCQRCGKKAEQGFKIDGSHVKPESHYHSLSAEPLNIKALCFTCHEWWHSNPTESGKWFAETFPERQKQLNIMAMRTERRGKDYWKNRLGELQAIYQTILQ